MKRILFLLMAVVTMMSLNGAPVSHVNALKMASNFMKVRMEEKALPVETLVEVSLDRSLQLEHLYVFTGDHSFVILSADDRAMPVLGYALDRPFSTENIPVNMLSWLQGYENEIRYLEEHRIEAPDSVREAWDALAQGTLWQPVNRTEVLPLIASKWGQHEPFNYYCPNNCVTGCVATAMSQIMKYWEYPNKGTGGHSYNHPTYGNQSANFGNTTYDWDKMTFTPNESCPLAEKQAIGTLMYHCGVAVEMDYGLEISSSYSADVPDAMIQYFGYNPGTVMDEKDYYTDAGWKTLIKDELNQSRPVYYAGNNATSTGGHAFICDGYDNRDYFHFNWGWTGNHDAYYMIGSLNPTNAIDLSYLNRIITRMYPASYALQAPTNLRATVDGNDIRLTWNAAAGASSYNVYRNGSLIATRVSGTSYVDAQLGYSTYSYYVKALNSNGDRSPRSSSVEAQITYSIPAPTAVTGQFDHDKASVKLSWEAPMPETAELHYGLSNYEGASGYDGYPNYWGQRYPISTITPLAGMSISDVEAYLRVAGDYYVYVYTGNELGTEELLYSEGFRCPSEGYYDLEFSTPVALDYSHDLWVVLYATASISHPAVYCSYGGAGSENAAYLSYSGDSWYTFDDGRSWVMNIILEAPYLTYKVTRNGTVLVDNLEDAEYEDNHLVAGDLSYRIQTNGLGMTSNPSEAYAISLADIQVTVDVPAGGEVSGGGLCKVGDNITLRAVAHAGYQFKGWKENGATISTNPNYSFVVNADRDLTASFQRNNGVEDLQDSFVFYPNPAKSQLRIESNFVIQKMELVALDGAAVIVKEINATELDCDVTDLARGVYFLRLVTEAGVITKKVVLSEP